MVIQLHQRKGMLLTVLDESKVGLESVPAIAVPEKPHSKQNDPAAGIKNEPSS